MQAIIRAFARLGIMVLVMAAVVVGALFAGLAATTAVALGIVLTGVVGLVGVARKPPAGKLTNHEEIAAMMAPKPVAPAPAARSALTAVEAMAPPLEREVDPEANMPRWRRPSLLEARHADYSRQSTTYHMPMRFSEDGTDDLDVRVVRYAVVPVLDRPDEVLGLQLSHLAAGDEIQVLASSGAFVQVLCPNGDQGWVHRTTLGQRGSVGLASSNGRAPMPREADDALNALLTARGLI
jgi:hypothetical protein